MKHFFGKTALPPLVIAVLLLTAAILLACGPASQGEPQGQPTSQVAAQDSDPEPTTAPTLTPTPEPPKYPNLDTFLQDLVTKYEDDELSEVAAAAGAPMYYEGSIFVHIHFSTDADAVATWREEKQLPHLWPYVDDTQNWLAGEHIYAIYRPDPEQVPFIYAYVPVSKLGILSQREGVILVEPLEDRDGSFADSQGAAGASGSSGDTGPHHPLWLKDDEAPYAKFSTILSGLLHRYDRGELTAEQVVTKYGHGKGNSVRLSIELTPDPANTEAVAAWLRSNGVTPSRVSTSVEFDNAITAYVPVSLLAELVKQPGIRSIPHPEPLLIDVPILPTSTPTPDPQSYSPTSPVPGLDQNLTVSQGVAAHGANAWHSAGYKGAGVKIGIIDGGFDNFASLMGTELPPGIRVEALCYDSSDDTTPSDDVSDCAGSKHGTAVAEAIADMAPAAALYISNAGSFSFGDSDRAQLKSAVDRMIAAGVDIINLSGSWGYRHGLGDGVPRQIDDQLATIDTAATAGITWVNAAGNHNERVWQGAFSDTTSPADRVHDFAPGDDRNVLRFTGDTWDYMRVVLRWDDDWADADCDIDLVLYRQDADGNTASVKSSRDTQYPGFNNHPVEYIRFYTLTPATYYVRIEKRLWATDARCSHVDWVQLAVLPPFHLEHTSSIHNIPLPVDSKSEGFLAVGAAKHSTTTTIQPYSSRGPTNETTNPDTTTNPERVKPDLVGADCGRAVSSTVSATDADCWFRGTSQAAPHVAGLAALVLQRYDPDGHYTPKDVADWLQGTALQRLTTDPNNTWGHGFATLPSSPPTASLSPVPLAIKKGNSLTLTANTSPATISTRLQMNMPGDTGNLSLNTTCPGPDETGTSKNNGQSITLKACSVGDATVRLYKTGSKVLLKVYRVSVASTTAVLFRHLTPSMVPGEQDTFNVALVGMTPNSRHTLRLSTNNTNIGFNSSCTTSTLTNFTPSQSAHSIQYDLHACGATSGTVTAELRRGSVSGLLLASKTFNVAVEARPTASLSPVPSTLSLGQNATFTLTTNVPAPGIYVRVNQSGDSGQVSVSDCPSYTGVGQEFITGASITIRACTAGTAHVNLYKGNTLVTSYAVTVTDTDTASLSPTPLSITKGSTVTYTLSTTASGNIRFIANHTGDTGNLSYTTSCNGGTNAQYFRSNGATLTLKGCTAGSVTLKLYKHKGAQGASGTDDENYSLVRTYNINVTEAGAAPPTASGTPATQSVNVNGSTTVDVSSDFTGTDLSYSASSLDATKATASIPASSSTMTITGVAAGSTTITVTATDSAGRTATQTYSVTVTAATTTPTPGGPTIPTGGPSVNAGSDQTVARGATVSLAGTGSPVDDDDDASYSWTQRYGTTVSLKNSTTPSLPYSSGLSGNAAKFTAPSTAGTLIFRLTVTDAGTNISSWDELAVTVQ